MFGIARGRYKSCFNGCFVYCKMMCYIPWQPYTIAGACFYNFSTTKYAHPAFVYNKKFILLFMHMPWWF